MHHERPPRERGVAARLRQRRIGDHRRAGLAIDERQVRPRVVDAHVAITNSRQIDSGSDIADGHEEKGVFCLHQPPEARLLLAYFDDLFDMKLGGLEPGDSAQFALGAIGMRLRSPRDA